MTIDTKNKTVIPDGESLGEITASLQAMFPGGEWKEYKVTATPITITLKEIVEVDKGMQQIPYVPYIPYGPFTTPVNPLNPPIWLWDPNSAPQYGTPYNNCDITITDGISTTTWPYGSVTDCVGFDGKQAWEDSKPHKFEM